MVRQTSAEAFHKIRNEGLLSASRLKVYEALYKHGPATGNELFKKLGGSALNAANITTRLGELREMGVAKEVGRKKCTVTGMTVILWDVTDRLPAKPVKKRPSDCVECPWCRGTGKVKLTPQRATTIVHYENQGVQLNIFGADL